MEYRTYGALSTSKESVRLLSRLKREDDRVKNSLLGIQKPSFYFSFYILVYIGFLCLGSIIFSVLETPVEISARIQLHNRIADFRRTYPNVSERALEELILEVAATTRRGISVSFNETQDYNWSFAQSMFFTSGVVTTIGYGHIVPLSRSGKLFCILYGLVGIPLTLVLLSGLVERLLVPSMSLLRWLNYKLGHLYHAFNIRLLHLAIIVIILMAVCIFLPAAAFYYMEDAWSYLDAIYYCFISLTTIGLGDYVPGDSHISVYRSLYKVVTTVYLFLGIAAMMLTLTIFYDIPQLNLGLLFSLNPAVSPGKPQFS